MRRKIFIVIFSVFLFVTLSQTVLAVSWWPLVPCGLNSQDDPSTPITEGACNRCDLFKLLKNIIDFVLIGLMPPAAAILFVWGGFLILMGGANPGWISQGRSIFWSTAVGVAIVLASWLITNSIIRSLAADNVAPEWWKFQCSVTIPPTSTPTPTGTATPTPTGSVTPTTTPPIPTNLVITTSSLSDARQDFDYSQTIQAIGGTAPYTWSISSGTLPAGLTGNPSSGEISGKPTTVGNYTFTVTVEDSSSPKKSVNKQLSVKVVGSAASVVISNVGSSNITANSATITWITDKLSTSQVEGGMTTSYGTTTPLNSTLVTSHSVAITGLSPGTTYNYRVISTVTDFTARSSNNTFRTTGSTVQPLSITTSSLPGGTVGQSYSSQVSSSGGTTPYTWSISSGILPAGLTGNPSSGAISGTPTIAGTAIFIVKVEDSSSPKQSATKQLSIVVAGGGGNRITYGTCSGVACQGDTTRVCGPVDPGDGCDLSAVNSLNAAIVSGIGNRTICSGINTVKMLKTIIANESDGRVDIGSVDGQSSGPFQLTPATANRYRASCGVTQLIDFNWLRRMDTVDEQACIAAEFIKSFVGSCGCDIRQIAAGYNGGPTACADSNACGEQAVANGGQCSACNVSRPTRKWECLWEDTQHNSCNIDRAGGGYSHTRIYAPRVEFCYNRF